MRLQWKIVLSFLLLVSGITLFSTQYIILTTYKIDSPKLDLEKSIRLVQLSDFHNTTFFPDNGIVINKIKHLEPDIIVITGDIINIWAPDEKIVFSFIKNLIAIAPVYFITGNHEYTYFKSNVFLEQMKSMPIHFLDNRASSITINNQTIHILGLSDYIKESIHNPEQFYANHMASMINFQTETEFALVLVHRPKYVSTISSFNPDLILAGHTHGGQVSLPFIGPLYLPEEGFFPQKIEKTFQSDNATVIVSNGLGNGQFPLRFLVNPEIILIELK